MKQRNFAFTQPVHALACALHAAPVWPTSGAGMRKLISSDGAAALLAYKYVGHDHGLFSQHVFQPWWKYACMHTYVPSFDSKFLCIIIIYTSCSLSTHLINMHDPQFLRELVAPVACAQRRHSKCASLHGGGIYAVTSLHAVPHRGSYIAPFLQMCSHSLVSDGAKLGLRLLWVCNVCLHDA